MPAKEIEGNIELQQVLWACFNYWQTQESLPLQERSICFNWVIDSYKEKFGSRFHQSKLKNLVKLGFLKPADTTRGGNRRYYTIVDPDRVNELLQQWGML